MAYDKIHEKVSVVAGGQIYDQWESVQVEHDMMGETVTAILATTEIGPWGEAPAFDKWNFPPGTPIEVYGNGELLVAGFVWAYMPSADADQHNVVVFVKTMAYNFAVSSVVHPTHNFENTTDQEIVEKLAEFTGTKITNYTNPVPIPWYQLRVGATNRAESLRLLQNFQKIMMPWYDGSLAIIAGQAFGELGAVIQGVNIKKMSATLKDETYQVYTVIGQSPLGTSLPEHLQPFAMVFDIARQNRKSHTTLEQIVATKENAQKRADWQRRRAAGASTEARIVVPGWRDAHGAFWRSNFDVYVNAPWLQIDCNLRLIRCVMSQDLANGTTTELTLVDPRAIGEMDIAACNSHAMWDVGSGWKSYLDEIKRWIPFV